MLLLQHFKLNVFPSHDLGNIYEYIRHLYELTSKKLLCLHVCPAASFSTSALQEYSQILMKKSYIHSSSVYCLCD